MKIKQDMTPEQRLLCEVFGEAAIADFLRSKGPEVTAELATAIDKALGTLPSRLSEAIKFRFGLVPGLPPQTYEKVGSKLGVTRERARQIIAKALRMLRHPTRIYILMRFTPHYDPNEEVRRVENEKMAEKMANKAFTESLERLGSLKIDILELSARPEKCLCDAKVDTISQLCDKSETELMEFKNFGRKSLWEIKSKLGERGLKLACVL